MKLIRYPHQILISEILQVSTFLNAIVTIDKYQSIK
jgi:hypothetical protein